MLPPDMLAVCWVGAAVEMSRDEQSHSSDTLQHSLQRVHVDRQPAGLDLQTGHNISLRGL